MGVNLDMDCLRSFTAIAELGSFGRAAERVGRSLSAVSLQVDRLELQVGTALFRKEGRRKVLTEAGERMLMHARHILGANDAALAALAGESVAGPVRLGIVQDLAEHTLKDVLGDYARAHRGVRLEVKVERSRALVEAVEAGTLDIAIAFDVETGLTREVLAETDMIWIGSRLDKQEKLRPLPLVLFEAPCAFRAAAIKRLEQAGIDWRHALSSPGLSGLRAGVEAGLGITVRTRAFLAAQGTLIEVRSLPPLPRARFMLYSPSGKLTPAVANLAALCRDRLRLL